jgi:hypothetical protein
VKTLSTALGTCKVNHYCPLGTWYDTQFPCTDGYHATGTAQTVECIDKCPAGKLCIKGNTNIDCPKNHYCPLGATSAQPCPDGKQSLAGADALTGGTNNCEPCPQGSICPILQKDINPIACSSLNMYMPTAESIGPCALIPAGSVKTGTDNKSLVACTAGKWNELGEGANLSTCADDCPAGYFCTGGAKTICPLGKYCAAGASVDTTNCTNGKYCPSGAPYEIPCPAGYFSAAGAGACTITTAGKAAGTEALAEVNCDAGYQCAAGATGPKSKVCPINTFIASGENPTPGTCAVCTEGNYCLPGLPGLINTGTAGIPSTGTNGGTELPCPLGHYCPAASNHPVPCPKGKYADSTGSTTTCKACDLGRVCS